MKRVIILAVLWVIAPVVGTAAPEKTSSQRRVAAEGKKAEASSPPLEADFEKVVLPRSLEGPIDPDAYVLGPSDELLLVLRGPDTRIHYLLVLPEGNVILPNVGSMPASGRTLSEFRSEVKRSLGRFYRNIEIDCQLSRPRSFVVFVLGEVRSPRAVELVAPFRMSNALVEAGGVKSTGSSRRIEIREEGRTVRVVDFFLFTRLGDFGHNPMLKEGQSVFVPPSGDRVNVIGEIRLPGMYEVVGGETAGDILGYCGGLTSRGDGNRILLERLVDGKAKAPVSFTLEEASTIEVRDMDVLIVRDVMSFGGGKPVLVMGGGGRTGRINIDAAEPLRDFLGRLWRFDPAYEIETAVLERNADRRRTVYVPFNVRKVLAGDAVGETPVGPGDVISFPPEENHIFITGEVREPGAVRFLPGSTAEYYIARVGGPSEDGSFGKLSIYSVDGMERKGNRNSQVYRGETVVVKRSTSKVFGSVFVGITSLTGLILGIIAVSNR
ncbi:MAG: SLBB domain-containing protein [Candidatus Krumholzibacteriia bacterium]